MDQIISHSDCLFTPIVDPDWRSWQPGGSGSGSGSVDVILDVHVSQNKSIDERNLLHDPASRTRTGTGGNVNADVNADADAGDDSSDIHFVKDWFQAYGAEAFQGNPHSYLERAWCRVEMLFASNLPLSPISPIRHNQNQNQNHSMTLTDKFTDDNNNTKEPRLRGAKKLVDIIRKHFTGSSSGSGGNENPHLGQLHISHSAIIRAAERMVDIDKERRSKFTAGLGRIIANGWRPQFVYGTLEMENNLPLKVMPPLSYSFLKQYNPMSGNCSVISDKLKILAFLTDLKPFINKAEAKFTRSRSHSHSGSGSGSGSAVDDARFGSVYTNSSAETDVDANANANGIRNGKGKYTYPDGSVFVGTYINDSREGKGNFTWVNGAYFSGNYINDKRNGYGEYESAGGTVYKGEWKDNLRHGKGTFLTLNEVLEGEFRDNDVIFGKQVYNSGNIYEGKCVLLLLLLLLISCFQDCSSPLLLLLLLLLVVVIVAGAVAVVVVVVVVDVLGYWESIPCAMIHFKV